MAVISGRSKTKYSDRAQQAEPYEAPINVRQIGNLSYGNGLSTDYYEPMASTKQEVLPDKSAMHVAVVLHDDPYEGTRYDVAPLAMEMARRGMAAFTPSLSKSDAEPFFLRQLGDLFDLLADLVADKFGLGLRPQTYAADGNKIVLVGCGTGAMLATVAMRLYHNARMREYFAAQCPAVRRFFAMGATPTVVFDDLVRIGGLVSMSGNVHPTSSSAVYDYDRWLGKGFVSTKLFDYLDLSRWYAPSYPPVLLVTAGADVNRQEALSVARAWPSAACRWLDLPREDNDNHLLDTLFWARHPLWTKSKEVNSQIVTYCRNL